MIGQLAVKVRFCYEGHRPGGFITVLDTVANVQKLSSPSLPIVITRFDKTTFSSNTVDEIFGEVNWLQYSVRSVLEEWFRVLKEDGRVDFWSPNVPFDELHKILISIGYYNIQKVPVPDVEGDLILAFKGVGK